MNKLANPDGVGSGDSNEGGQDKTMVRVIVGVVVVLAVYFLYKVVRNKSFKKLIK